MNLVQSIIPNFDFIVLQSLAMILTAILLPGLKVTSVLGPTMTVVAISWINNIFWDASLFFQIPLHPSLQSIALVAINGVIFWIIVKILPGIEIKGFLTALLAPLIFTASSSIIIHYIPKINWPAVLIC